MIPCRSNYSSPAEYRAIKHAAIKKRELPVYNLSAVEVVSTDFCLRVWGLERGLERDLERGMQRTALFSHASLFEFIIYDVSIYPMTQLLFGFSLHSSL